MTDFWYIDLNGRVQHKSYMPTELDDCGVWFGNKFDSCEKAIFARDSIKQFLDEINPQETTIKALQDNK